MVVECDDCHRIGAGLEEWFGISLCEKTICRECFEAEDAYGVPNYGVCDGCQGNFRWIDLYKIGDAGVFCVYCELERLYDAIKDIWDCCESYCPDYYGCAFISKLDDIVKEIWG